MIELQLTRLENVDLGTPSSPVQPRMNPASHSGDAVHLAGPSVRSLRANKGEGIRREDLIYRQGKM